MDYEKPTQKVALDVRNYKLNRCLFVFGREFGIIFPKFSYLTILKIYVTVKKEVWRGVWGCLIKN